MGGEGISGSRSFSCARKIRGSDGGCEKMFGAELQGCGKPRTKGRSLGRTEYLLPVCTSMI